MKILMIPGLAEDAVEAFKKEVEKAKEDPEYVIVTNYHVNYLEVPDTVDPYALPIHVLGK